MAEYTPNYEFEKQQGSDYINIEGINSNFDIIDTELGKVNSELDDKASKEDIPSKLPADGGNADTVNGHTVESDVPKNAKFTDTIYTHPSTHPASIIEESASRRFVTDTEKSTWNGKANGSHTHDDRYYTESEVDNKLNTKANLNSPTFTGTPKAPNSTDYTTSRIRNIRFGTAEPTSLANGEIYFMYE